MGAATGAFSGAGMLAREGLRAAVPTLAHRRGSVSSRIAETRAIRQPKLAGYEPPSSSAPQVAEANRSKDQTARAAGRRRPLEDLV